MRLVAEHLRDRLYVVRPEGQLGTMGWSPKAWTAFFVRADSPEHAVKIATKKGAFL